MRAESWWSDWNIDVARDLDQSFRRVAAAAQSAYLALAAVGGEAVIRLEDPSS